MRDWVEMGEKILQWIYTARLICPVVRRFITTAALSLLLLLFAPTTNGNSVY